VTPSFHTAEAKYVLAITEFICHHDWPSLLTWLTVNHHHGNLYHTHALQFIDRFISKTDEKSLVRKKNNNRAAFVNRHLKLQEEALWQNASPQDQEEMEKALHAAL